MPGTPRRNRFAIRLMLLPSVMRLAGVSLAVGHAVKRAGVSDAVPDDMGGAQFLALHQRPVFGKTFPAMVFAMP